jgi:hypothetical protein
MIRPWFWIAFGAHILALHLPILPAAKSSQSVRPTQPETIKIPLSSIALPKAPDPIHSPSAVPRSPEVVLAVQPSGTAFELPLPVKSRLPVPVASPLPQPQLTVQAVVSPVPSPVLSPVLSPVPSPVLSPVPAFSPVPSPVSTPMPSPTPAASPQPWGNFPQVKGAQSGCHNSSDCWQTSDTQWRSIATNLLQTLKAQGYSVDELPLDNDTGRRIYLVSKSEENPYYLNLISTSQGTVYFLTERPMAAEAMNQVAGF